MASPKKIGGCKCFPYIIRLWMEWQPRSTREGGNDGNFARSCSMETKLMRFSLCYMRRIIIFIFSLHFHAWHELYFFLFFFCFSMPGSLHATLLILFQYWYIVFVFLASFLGIFNQKHPTFLFISSLFFRFLAFSNRNPSSWSWMLNTLEYVMRKKEEKFPKLYQKKMPAKCYLKWKNWRWQTIPSHNYCCSICQSVSRSVVAHRAYQYLFL